MASLATIKKAHADPHVVSASQMAVLAGLSKWATPLELYLIAVGSLPDDDTAGEAAYWGLKLEPLLLQEWADRNGTRVLGMDAEEKPCLFRPGKKPLGARTAEYRKWVSADLERLVTDTLRHPTLPIITHLDGVTLPAPQQVGGLVQAKTGSAYKRDEWGDTDTDEMPPPYLLQVQTEMLCFAAATGSDMAHLQDHVPVLLGGQEYRQYQATLSQRLGELIGALAEDFVRRVKEQDPPPPTPDKAGSRHLGVLNPGAADGLEVVAEPGGDLYGLAMAVRQAKLDQQAADAAYEAAAVALQEAMGDATKVVAPGVTITWSAAKKPRVATAWKGLAEELLKDLADTTAAAYRKDYTTTTPATRTFKVTPVDEENSAP